MEPLIEAVTTAVAATLDLPFAVFGHSAGAIMGFEMARELRRRGLPMPRILFVSAHAAPQILRRSEPIHHLSDPEFIEQLIRRYDAIPSTVLLDRDLMKMFTPVLKADMEVLHTYTYAPEAPLPCPISALGGVLDSTVAASQLEAWQQQTDASFRLRMFPGKHFFLKEARPQVLSAIREDLSI
jgi:medium-chain acyl-[acyl-carrier-protein] hydrolase